MDWERKRLLDFSAGKTHQVSFDWSYNTVAIDFKMNGSTLEGKSSFEMLGLTFSSKLDWGPSIINLMGSHSKLG